MEEKARSVESEPQAREGARAQRGGRAPARPSEGGRRPLGAAVAGGAAGVALLLSRLVRLIVGLIVALIVIGILLRVLDANARNSLVSSVHDAAKSLVGPFKDVFTEKDPKVSIAVNWGLAAAVYLAVGSVLAILIAQAGRAGRRD